MGLNKDTGRDSSNVCLAAERERQRALRLRFKKERIRRADNVAKGRMESEVKFRQQHRIYQPLAHVKTKITRNYHQRNTVISRL